MSTDTSRPGAPDTVVLIHGLWMTALSWENWAKRYEARGMRVIARNWPRMDGDVEQLRANPAAYADLTATEILDHYDGIIRGLDRPPIIMGHSFGGVFTQLLINRGLGAAGVAVDSAAVRGVRKLPLTTLRSSWPLLRNPLMRKKSIPLNPSQFHYAFTNSLSDEESEQVYMRYAIPAPRNVLLEGAFADANPGTALKVDFKKSDRAPLLFIGGGEDHVIPASVNRANAGKYGKSTALTEFKEFPGRTHYTLGQEGWEEVADYALDWALRNARVPAAV